MAPKNQQDKPKPSKKDTDKAPGGGTIGSAPKADTLKPKDLKKMYGLTAAIVNANKDLGDAIKRIIDEKITNTSLIDQIIMDTNWFRGYTNTWLQVDRERKSKSPEIWEAQVAEKVTEIKRQFESAGASIDDATARDYAENLIYGSGRIDGKTVFYNQDWMRQMIAGAIDYSKTKTVNGVVIRDLQGEAGAYSQQLSKLASDYGMDISMSSDAFNSWFENSLRQLMENPDPDKYMVDVTGELRDNAVSMFPGLAQQIQRGSTLRQAMDPYMQAIASELEYDPNTFDLRDDLLQKIVNNVDEQGNHKPVSLYQARLMARKDERWKYTGTAKKEYTDIGNQILKDFGFLG